MSWQITLSGHSTNDDVEAEKVNRLFVDLVSKADKEALNATYGQTSTNGGSLTLEQARKEEHPA